MGDNIKEAEIVEQRQSSPLPQKAQPTLLTFPQAMQEVINGKSIARAEWQNNDYCLLKDTYLTIYREGKFHTWMVNDGDLLAIDWIVLPEGN